MQIPQHMIMIIFRYHGIYQSPTVLPSDTITAAMQKARWFGQMIYYVQAWGLSVWCCVHLSPDQERSCPHLPPSGVDMPKSRKEAQRAPLSDTAALYCWTPKSHTRVCRERRKHILYYLKAAFNFKMLLIAIKGTLESQTTSLNGYKC